MQIFLIFFLVRVHRRGGRRSDDLVAVPQGRSPRGRTRRRSLGIAGMVKGIIGNRGWLKGWQVIVILTGRVGSGGAFTDAGTVGDGLIGYKG